MYERLIRAALQTPWAITDEYAGIITGILVERASGVRLTAEDVQARIGAASPPPPVAAPRGVGVIPIFGVLAHRTFQASSGMMSAEQIAALVRRAKADDEIGTVIFDVSSPGGSVDGIQEAAAAIADLGRTKHTIAVANAQMASAAYWLASQTHEVVATPSAMSVGSIGVFTLHESIAKALELKGIEVTVISAGKRKTDGHPFAPLSAEMKAHLQGKVDAVYAAFVKDVARGRGVSVSDVRDGFGEGLALSATEAKAAGLVDQILTMDEVIARVMSGKWKATSARAETVFGLVTETEVEPVMTLADAGAPPMTSAPFADEDAARDAAAILAGQ